MYIPKPTIITYVYTKAYYNIIYQSLLNVYTKAYYNYLCISQSLLQLLMYIPKPTIITYVYTKAYYNYLCIYQSLL